MHERLLPATPKSSDTIGRRRVAAGVSPAKTQQSTLNNLSHHSVLQRRKIVGKS